MEGSEVSMTSVSNLPSSFETILLGFQTLGLFLRTPRNQNGTGRRTGVT